MFWTPDRCIEIQRGDRDECDSYKDEYNKKNCTDLQEYDSFGACIENEEEDWCKTCDSLLFNNQVCEDRDRHIECVMVNDEYNKKKCKYYKVYKDSEFSPFVACMEDGKKRNWCISCANLERSLKVCKDRDRDRDKHLKCDTYQGEYNKKNCIDYDKNYDSVAACIQDDEDKDWCETCESLRYNLDDKVCEDRDRHLQCLISKNIYENKCYEFIRMRYKNVDECIRPNYDSKYPEWCKFCNSLSLNLARNCTTDKDDNGEDEEDREDRYDDGEDYDGEDYDGEDYDGEHDDGDDRGDRYDDNGEDEDGEDEEDREDRYDDGEHDDGEDYDGEHDDGDDRGDRYDDNGEDEDGEDEEDREDRYDDDDDREDD